jgi:5-methylthioadenosine/S-adenosylhomocysteine deaminase
MTISPACAAVDVYAGNYVGALEALEAGVTTILDFSHCNNTPEHAPPRPASGSSAA